MCVGSFPPENYQVLAHAGTIFFFNKSPQLWKCWAIEHFQGNICYSVCNYPTTKICFVRINYFPFYYEQFSSETLLPPTTLTRAVAGNSGMCLKVFEDEVPCFGQCISGYLDIVALSFISNIVVSVWLQN